MDIPVSISLPVSNGWAFQALPQTFSFSVQTRFLKHGHKIIPKNDNKTIFRPQNDAKSRYWAGLFSAAERTHSKDRFPGFIFLPHLAAENDSALNGLSFTGTYFRINEKELSMQDQNDPSALFGPPSWNIHSRCYIWNLSP